MACICEDKVSRTSKPPINSFRCIQPRSPLRLKGAPRWAWFISNLIGALFWPSSVRAILLEGVTVAASRNRVIKSIFRPINRLKLENFVSFHSNTSFFRQASFSTQHLTPQCFTLISTSEQKSGGSEKTTVHGPQIALSRILSGKRKNLQRSSACPKSCCRTSLGLPAQWL